MTKLLLASVLTITMLQCNDNPNPTTSTPIPPAPVLTPPQQNPPKMELPKTKQLADICGKIKCSKIGNACVPDGAYASAATVYTDSTCTKYAAWVDKRQGCYDATIFYAVLFDDHDPTCGSKPGALVQLGKKLDTNGLIWYIDGETQVCTSFPVEGDVFSVIYETITRFDDIICN